MMGVSSQLRDKISLLICISHWWRWLLVCGEVVFSLIAL
jgi:hypothetical protein